MDRLVKDTKQKNGRGDRKLMNKDGKSVQEQHSGIHPLLRPPASATPPMAATAERSTTDVVEVEASERVKTLPFGSSSPISTPVKETRRPGVFNETMEFGTDELVAAMRENTQRHETNSWIQAMESPNWPPKRPKKCTQDFQRDSKSDPR